MPCMGCIRCLRDSTWQLTFQGPELKIGRRRVLARQGRLTAQRAWPKASSERFCFARRGKTAEDIQVLPACLQSSGRHSRHNILALRHYVSTTDVCIATGNEDVKPIQELRHCKFPPFGCHCNEKFSRFIRGL